MHITILAAGTRGDVQPYVAVGKGLKQAGHQVKLATHSSFEPLVRSHGLDFALVGGNPQQVLEEDRVARAVKAIERHLEEKKPSARDVATI